MCIQKNYKTHNKYNNEFINIKDDLHYYFKNK